MINRIRSMFTPPKQLDIDIDSSTPLQTPIKRESNITAPQQNTQSTATTATAELLTSAINTVISQTTKETEFKIWQTYPNMQSTSGSLNGENTSCIPD